MSYAIIKPSSLKGEITVPPSKSAAHRALICSFLAGEGNVKGIIPSDDMRATQGALNALKNNSAVIDCIESGSTLRFILPLAAALGREATFTGSGRLPKRPIGEYLRLFSSHGVKCESSGGLPLKISGKLTPGLYDLPGNISSQYVTGLLLSLPLLDGDSEIVVTTPLESKAYVDMTLKIMKDFGVFVSEKDGCYYIKGKQKYKNRDYTVEGDWSQAAFFLAAGAISGDVAVKGLDMNSVQGDREICTLLSRFGAEIEISEDKIRTKKSELRGIEIDAKNIPDAVPALAVLGAYAKGETVIYGAQRLRLKESDRIKSVTQNLQKMGVPVKEMPDGMVITGKAPKGAHINGFNDHRIVMAFSIAALCAEGDTVITQAQSINKSYPGFFDDYKLMGGVCDVIRDGK